MKSGKRVAVIQSNYIPWKGYFDIIHDADVFVFYDDVQYTKNDWRNRNKIKTANGISWLTIPIGSHTDKLICEIELVDKHWRRKHWETVRQAYARAACFKQYRDFFEHVYLEREWATLSELNQYLIRSISTQFLGIRTEFRDSREFCLTSGRLDRLLDLLEKVAATVYISGPAAKGYIDEKRFAEAGIDLVYKDYSGYPEYPQLTPPFVHDVSILDLLFNCGSSAPDHIWGWRSDMQLPQISGASGEVSHDAAKEV